MIKKIAHILFIIALAVGMFLLLGFAVESNKNIPCQKFVVNVNKSCGHDFISADEVRNKIYSLVDTIEGRTVNNGLLKDIKSIVEGIPYAQNAHIYRTIDGEIRVNVSQRQPMLRVINRQNQSYYIDREGRLLPMNSNYTARVKVATGNIHLPYSPGTDLSKEKNPEKLSASEKTMRNLYQLASFINDHKFWNAFIDHIAVLPNGEFELIPKNAVHVIEFGGIDQMEEKFRKLMVFYQNGLTRVGWYHYNRINLKFSNQVVCSK